MLDHVPPNVFWPLLLIAAAVIGTLIARAIIRAIDASNPKRRNIHTVDHARCERAGSQAEFTRRMRAGGSR